MGIFDPFDWNHDGKHDFQDIFIQNMIFHEMNKKMSDKSGFSDNDFDNQNDLELERDCWPDNDVFVDKDDYYSESSYLRAVHDAKKER